MLLTLLLAAIPSTIGTAQGIASQRSHDTEAEQTAKFNLVAVDCASFAEYCVLLKNGKLYISNLTNSDHPLPSPYSSTAPHPFRGFFIPYPPATENSPTHLGLVSTISNDPPLLNWIYAEKTNMRLQYGNKTASMEHVTGRWSWTDGGEFLTLEGDGRFLAVEEEENEENREALWVMHFNPDGRQSQIESGRRSMQVWLKRKMVPVVKEIEEAE